jgi:hypothetical protein
LPIQARFQRRPGHGALQVVLGQCLLGRAASAKSLHINGDEKPELQSLEVMRAPSARGTHAFARLSHDVTLPFRESLLGSHGRRGLVFAADHARDAARSLIS